MNKSKKSRLKNILYSIWPLILYQLISNIISYGYMMVEYGHAGFAVLESEISQSNMVEYVMQNYLKHTVEIVIYSDLICLLIFVWMYGRELKKRAQMNRGMLMIVLDMRSFMWGICGSAALAIILNCLISLTPLMRISDIAGSNALMGAEGMSMLMLASLFLAPIAEELMMRGLLYTRLKQFTSVKKAMVYSALLFGMMHGNIAQGVYAFCMGLFFAWAYEKSGTILVPIAAHIAANLAMIALSGPIMGSPLLMAAVTLLSGMIAGQSIRVIKNSTTKLEH